MALESLKDAYYSLEDKIGKSGVIGIVVAAIVLIAAAGFFLFQGTASEMKAIDLRISDSSGAALEGVLVTYTVNEISGAKTTDADGRVSFDAPLNASVLVEISTQTISGTEFEEHTESFTVSDNVSKEISLQAVSAAVEKTIIFKGTNNARITGKLIAINLSCANGFAISPGNAVDSDKDGVIRVMQPQECDVLTAIVTGPPEFKQATIKIDSEPKTALLEPVNVDLPKGTLRITVKNQTGDLVTDTSFTVTITKPDGAPVDEKFTGSYGEAIFTGIATGTYNASITDDSGAYGIAFLSGLTVAEGQTKEAGATVSKNIKRTIKVTVLDKQSNAKISNATVQLIDSYENIIAEDSTGSEGNTVVFPLAETGDFSVLVSHDEYIYERLELGETDSDVTIKLEKLTPENSRIVRVKVLDEDLKNVEGAKVALRTLEDGVLATPYKITDYNGIAVFSGLKQVKYYAYATKEPVAFADNKDSAAEPDIQGITDFVVELVIGNATLKLSASNSDDEPITEVEAEIFSADGKSLGRVPLPQGSADYTMKADNKVYVVFTHQDYAKLQTLPQQLWPDREFEFKASMTPKAISGTLKIENEGIFAKSGEKTTLFSSGEKYLAVFKVTVPENTSFETLGLHFRTGDEKLFENDPMAVVEGVVGKPSAIIKGLTFNAPIGYEEDSKNLSEGDAKWINVSISNAESGVYYFGVWFRVKKTTLPSTLLAMHYRAYGINSSNSYARAPADDELGNSENTQQKQALYAKTIDNLRFYEGEAPNCEEEFCYSGEWCYDNIEKLYLDAPYEGTILADYNCHFSITNNSDKAFENAEINIRNYTGDESKEELKFRAYTIEDAGSKKTSNFNLQLNRIEKINLGNFLKGTSISGNLLFNTLKIGPGKIYLYIIADSRRIFEKTIDFKINSNKKMEIAIFPDTIPAFAETATRATVTYKKEFEESLIENAKVTLTKTNPDDTKNVFTATTNSSGIADFNLPASSPGTKLVFTAEKTGYFADPVEKEIGTATISFDPPNLNAELDTRKTTEEFFDEKIINETGADFIIDSIIMPGKIAKILDTTAMLNYSENFKGEQIKALDTTEIEKLLLVRLRAEAARELAQNTQMDGNFWISLIEQKSGNKFDFQVPLKLGITIAEIPKEACISISKSEWTASTQGNKATLEFEVQNSCEADGQALALENLMARIVWSSSQNGTVELSLTDSETGETNTETLAMNWSKLFGKVRPGASFSGFLTFTPKQGQLGKDSQFAVEIDGQMLSSSGLKFVGANPKAINATIKIINLEQCIQSKEAEELLKISAGTKEVKFSLDSSECGATEIEISLCREDSGKCSGGAEGSIQLSKTEFTLTPEKPKIEITAYSGEIPGMYGIILEAKVPGKGWQKVRVIDLLIEPDEDSIFSLDKYAFVIKGTGSKDSATLSNKNVVETVTVDASVCDWTEGYKKGKDKSNNSMLPLAAMPLMMGVLPPMMSAMANSTEGIVKAKEEPTAKIAKASTEKALADAKQANKDIGDIKKTVVDDWGKNFGKPGESSLGAVETARKKLDEVNDLIIGKEGMLPLGNLLTGMETNCTSSGCQALVVKLIAKKKALEESIKKAKTDMDKCSKGTDSKFGKAIASAKDAADSSGNALGDATKGTGLAGAEKQLTSAIETEKPKTGSAGVSDAANAGAQLENQIAPKIDSATTQLWQAKDKLSNDKSGLSKNLQDFKDCLSGVKDSVHQIKIDSASISAGNCTGCSQLTAAQKRFSDIENKSKELEDTYLYKNLDQEIDSLVKEKLDPAVKNLGALGPVEPKSGYLADLATAQDNILDAKKKKLELGNATMPLQEVSRKAPSDPAMNAAMQNMAMQAMMAMMMGSMLGGGNDSGDDSNPCNDRVQQPVTAWVINLNENSLPISMDKPGISAYWDNEDMKLLGQYEKQDIGIVFENTGIADPEPVYSTASIKAKQTRHSPTIKFPEVKGLDKISNPMLQMTASGLTGPSYLPGTIQNVTQKFHLKFTTMDFIAPLPPVIGENMCLQGTMIGATGESALPRTQLNWNWGDNGITEDSCIESETGIYCDATQFSILLSKRLKKLQEFIEKNSAMSCPENPGAEIIAEITKNYNQYLAQLGMDPIPANIQGAIGCWIPKSTMEIGNVSGTGAKTALEYYIEENSINWTNDIKNIDDLRKLLKFKAFLMKDNYNSNFKADFADYYTKTALMNAPEWFTHSLSGKWADYFYSESNLAFTRKSLDSTELLAPGVYEVSLNIDFNNEWQFFDSEGKPSANALIVFNYLQEPYPNSVFYYMPFNGDIGRNSSTGRNGYGLNYENETEPFTITGAGNEAVTTSVIPGSAGTTTLNSSISRDAKNLNSIASNRGALLKINQGEDNYLSLVFSPNYATPVSMKIHSEQSPDKFSAFYELIEAGTPKQAGSHLGFWTAMGQCYDFTGVPLSDRFDFSTDRQAESTDSISNWQFSYAVDWDKAEKAGNVYLRTIFYTPAGAAYTLAGLAPSSLEFSTPETGFQKTVELTGISTLGHNNQKANDSVSSMQTLFEMVKAGNVCVTNNGAEALFWWNPGVLYETAGSNNSQKSLNDSIECIKN